MSYSAAACREQTSWRSGGYFSTQRADMLSLQMGRRVDRFHPSVSPLDEVFEVVAEVSSHRNPRIKFEK